MRGYILKIAYKGTDYCGWQVQKNAKSVQETLCLAAKEIYGELYPEFKLITCESEFPIIEQWEKYGPPSRMNRWCCKVRKTSLFARTLKDELNTTKQPKCLVFEGVRADESTRREKYDRVGVGVKHVPTKDQIALAENCAKILISTLRVRVLIL